MPKFTTLNKPKRTQLREKKTELLRSQPSSLTAQELKSELEKARKYIAANRMRYPSATARASSLISAREMTVLAGPLRRRA